MAHTVLTRMTGWVEEPFVENGEPKEGIGLPLVSFVILWECGRWHSGDLRLHDQ